MREMFGWYDKELMRRGKAARQCIEAGEDPYRMLLQVVWPEHDWADLALRTRFTSCPECSADADRCDECGSTGIVSEERSRLLAIEALANYACDAA
jgi:hypothetical protein